MPRRSDIERKPFGKTHDGRQVEEVTLVSSTGATARLISYGATVTHLLVPDRKGQLGDVVLGFDHLPGYEFESPYFGSTVGRVANRIANGVFKLHDQRRALALNDGTNHLHGGFAGYDKRIWEVETAMMGGPSVRFTLVDPDGAEGYPGTVHVQVIFTLTAENGLKIQYFAQSDRSTPINLTNHSYFNLKDGGRTPIYDHVLQVHGRAYTPVRANLAPTGEIAPVTGTPIDFTSAKAIGRDLQAMGGFDHNLVLDNTDGSFDLAVEVTEPESGRKMDLYTTEPGVQFYSGNFLDGSVKGKDGIVYGKHHGFCLETQHFPDSVNQPSFPNTILRPGETYRQVTEYRFSTVAG